MKKSTQISDINAIVQAVLASMNNAPASNNVQLVATNEPQVITKAETEKQAIASLHSIIAPVVEAEKNLVKVVSNTSAALVSWAHDGLSKGLTALQLRNAIDTQLQYINEHGIKKSAFKVYLSQLRTVITNADLKIGNAKVRDALVIENKKGESKPASLKGAYDAINKTIKAKAKPLTAEQLAAERTDKLISEFKTLTSRVLRDSNLMHEVKKGIKVEKVTFEDNAFMRTAETLANTMFYALCSEADKHALIAQVKRLEAIRAELIDMINE